MIHALQTVDWVALISAVGTILATIGNLLASRRHQATMRQHVENVRASMAPPSRGDDGQS